MEGMNFVLFSHVEQYPPPFSPSFNADGDPQKVFQQVSKFKSLGKS